LVVLESARALDLEVLDVGLDELLGHLGDTVFLSALKVSGSMGFVRLKPNPLAWPG